MVTKTWNKTRKCLKARNLRLFLIDIAFFLFTPLLALVIRLDAYFEISHYWSGLIIITPLFLAIKLGVLFSGSFYRYCRQYMGLEELSQLLIPTAQIIVLQVLFFETIYYLIASPLDALPRSLPIIDGLLGLLVLASVRFFAVTLERSQQIRRGRYLGSRVIVVGAGNAGVSVVQQMQRQPNLGYLPVAFVDDDPDKQGLKIHGLSVMGDRRAIPRLIRSLKIRKVIIAIPSAPGTIIRETVEICRKVGAQTVTLPGIHELLNNRVPLTKLRNIQIEDLLRREPIQTDVQKVFQFLKGKRVLVTGAGGSIGSELCRQILKCQPQQVVLLGKGENSVFLIQQELNQLLHDLSKRLDPQHPLPHIEIFVTDIRCQSRLDYVFTHFHPDIVFHAAAHKHVPLMEFNSPEAVTCNILGTQQLVDTAVKHGVQHFVMISTDKAVNPTNVMGATKRVAEMIVLQAARKTGYSYVVVRFGNVLGSRGSVVPTFKRQIDAGGPITVTHPDVCRYFMTIPEAVQLVLQASVLGHGGEVMMLDMGKPVKIVDLAKDLIDLSGYELGRDIDILFTGLRPGEKLFEELFIPGEVYENTQHNKILIVQNASHCLSETLNDQIGKLCEAAERNDAKRIYHLLQQVVPGYTPNGSGIAVLQPEPDSQAIATAAASIPLLSPHVVQGSPTSMISTATQIETAMRLALDHDEFSLYYQPIICLETGALAGFEALLRWQRPHKSPLTPETFLPVAERSGLVIPLGWWAIAEVCRHIQQWQQRGLSPDVAISVNLSMQQLRQSDFVERLEQILQEYPTATHCLKLEISETFLREHTDLAIALLPQIRALGVQLQMDHIGTDYPFLRLLKHLPSLVFKRFDSLKFDSLVISEIEANQGDWEFVQAVMSTIHDLKIEMIATRVETSTQLDQLKGLRCTHGQGYLFSKPLSHEDARRLIDQHPRLGLVC